MATTEIIQALSTLSKQPVAIQNMTELHIVMGRQCNVRCDFCYQKSYAPQDDLAPEIVTGLLPLMGNLRCLIIQGGEPTVMKSCITLRDYLGKINYSGRLCFLTNGVLFKDEWIDFMLERKGEVHFSINASCKEVYDKIIRYGDFDAVIANMKRLVALKKERGQREPLIDVSFVIYEKNMWDILDFFKMVHEIGVHGCSFYIDCRQKGSKLFENMTDETLESYHQLIHTTIDTMSAHNFRPSELATLDYMIREIKTERAITKKMPERVVT